MRQISAVLFASMLAACGGSSASNTFNANLSGSSEVPPSGSSATGTATVTVNGATASYVINYTGLSGAPTASHIHLAASGTAGAVVVPFSGLPTTPAGTIQGTFTASDIKPSTSPAVSTMDDLVREMRAGNAYVNIHSAAHAGGEIRGQLAPK